MPNDHEEIADKIRNACVDFDGDMNALMKLLMHATLLLDRMKEHRDWQRQEVCDSDLDEDIARLRDIELCYFRSID